MDPATIVVDLDDVTFNFTDPFIQFANKKYGTKFTINDMSGYSMEASGIIPKGSGKKDVLEYGRSGGFRNAPLMPDAQESIWKLLRLGRIVYVSSRDPEFIQDSKEALKQHRLYFGELHLLNHGERKSDIVNKLGADIVIDDSPKVTTDVIENSRLCSAVILMTRIKGVASKGKKTVLTSNWRDTLNVVNSYIELAGALV